MNTRGVLGNVTSSAATIGGGVVGVGSVGGSIGGIGGSTGGVGGSIGSFGGSIGGGGIGSVGGVGRGFMPTTMQQQQFPSGISPSTSSSSFGADIRNVNEDEADLDEDEGKSNRLIA